MGTGSECEVDESWIDQELAWGEFQDERLGKRFRKLLQQLSDGTGESIPMACQDWANTKAAYRFFDNERVSEKEILAGHFQATRERFAATDDVALVLHDTTEFSYRREDGRAICKLSKSHIGTKSRPRHHTVCGPGGGATASVTELRRAVVLVSIIAAEVWVATI